MTWFIPPDPEQSHMAGQVETSVLRMAIHDMRNTLNAMGISLHLLEAAGRAGMPCTPEDSHALTEGVQQFRRMLQILGDYARLRDGEAGSAVAQLRTRSLLEKAALQAATDQSAVIPFELEIGPDCPLEVAYEPTLATMALGYAIGNAWAAARRGPVHAHATGSEDGRLRLVITLDEAPDRSDQGGSLLGRKATRVMGSVQERFGVDLAIVAQVTAWLRGTLDLEIEPRERSRLILDWPVQAPPPT